MALKTEYGKIISLATFDTLGDFPITGIEHILYKAEDTGDYFSWSLLDFSYIPFGAGGTVDPTISYLTTVTTSEANDLISTDDLIPGHFYKLIDAQPELYEGTNVIIQAATTNSFGRTGFGLFYNPNYDKNVEGFGIWSKIASWEVQPNTLIGTFESGEPITGDNNATGLLYGSLNTNKFIPLTGDWSQTSSITGDINGGTVEIFTGGINTTTVFNPTSGISGQVVTITNQTTSTVLISYTSTAGNYLSVAQELQSKLVESGSGIRYTYTTDGSTVSDGYFHNNNFNEGAVTIFFDNISVANTDFSVVIPNKVSTVVLPSYNINDKVIWGGRVWINLTGEVGLESDNFDLDVDNWQVIPYNETDYTLVVDTIEYDQEHDYISMRKDKSGNIVDCNFGSGFESSIRYFQWGNDYDDTSGKGLQNNIVKNSFFETINSTANTVTDNYLFQSEINAMIWNPEFEFQNNHFISSSIQNFELNGSFQQNKFDNCDFESLIFSNLYGAKFTSECIEYSTIEKTFSNSDKLGFVLNLEKLTIPQDFFIDDFMIKVEETLVGNTSSSLHIGIEGQDETVVMDDINGALPVLNELVIRRILPTEFVQASSNTFLSVKVQNVPITDGRIKLKVKLSKI